MTQAELARLCDVTRQTIIALEAEKYSPSLELAFRLARALGRNLEEVFQLAKKKNIDRANCITPDWLEFCVLNDRLGPLYSDSMLSDALSIVSWRSRPRSFVALMSLYESNYLRLASLAGDLRHLADVRVSRVPDDCDLRLSVTERSPYTTSFDLTYLFDPERPVHLPGHARARLSRRPAGRSPGMGVATRPRRPAPPAGGGGA